MVTVGWESGEKLVGSTAWDTGDAIHNNKASKTKDGVVLESLQPSVGDLDSTSALFTLQRYFN